jgi:hypothetical protein
MNKIFSIINFAHYADGFVQGDDDLLVMVDVLVGQHPARTGILPPNVPIPFLSYSVYPHPFPQTYSNSNILIENCRYLYGSESVRALKNFGYYSYRRIGCSCDLSQIL